MRSDASIFLLPESDSASSRTCSPGSTPTPTPSPSPSPNLSRKRLRSLDRTDASPVARPLHKTKAMSLVDAAPELADARDIRRALRSHHFYIDEEHSFERDNQVRKFAESIKNTLCSSPGLSEDEQRDVVTIVRRMQDHVEANVIDALVPFLFPLPEAALGKPGLAKNRDVELRQECVPDPETEIGSPSLRQHLETVGSPKPSLVFGYTDSSFSRRQASVNESFPDIAGLSRGMQHPFFFVEWKSGSNGGTLYDAQNQAMRTGAALVNARADLFELAYPTETASPRDACIFSCTIDTFTAATYVHWCTSDTSGNRYFYMNTLSVYVLVRKADVWQFEREVESITDWGLGRRLQETKAVLDVIFYGL
ncbi:hypothetical protein GP486_005096 [Trichoglossum hirsutum]|uniref:DUF7924 domain-containing protein n=1 Tax=Trichoglossum hirsutum TaxID=265104 RepID=A0A9P8L9X3_9PEZI|nr:hypothetical protein GP486_005096 [Trichoglossum hirsutum]